MAHLRGSGDTSLIGLRLRSTARFAFHIFSGVVRRTFALRASSFWRTWRPHAHHFSADSLFHGLPMCSVFRSKPKSHKHEKKFVSSAFLTAFSDSGSRSFFFGLEAPCAAPTLPTSTHWLRCARRPA